MKLLGAIFLLAVLAHGAVAQELAALQNAGSYISDAHFVNFDEPIKLALKEPGMRMLKAGRTLTILGGSMLMGGIIVYSIADKSYTIDWFGNRVYDDPKVVWGVLMIVGGVGMTVPGIVLWSIGAKKHNAYKMQLNGSLSIGPQGVGLRYHF